MKKILGILVILVSLISVNLVYASEMPEYVRVGLEERYKDVDKIHIDNNGISLDRNKQVQFDSGIDLVSTNGFTIQPVNNYFVEVGRSSDYYQMVMLNEEIQAKGYKSSVAMTENNSYSVYIYEDEAKSSMETIADETGGTIVKPKGETLFIYNNEGVAMIFDDPTSSLQISPLDSYCIILGDREYRGIIEINEYSEDKLTVVNILSTNEYLYGVVPSEMPASWPMEALKAQSVIARNYVWYRVENPVHEDYDVCDQVHCQRYLGFKNENPNTNQSVDQTQNVKMTYNGEPIEAVYFSSDGGATANSGDVWSVDTPYLKSVQDPYEKEYKEWERTFTMDEINLLAKQQGIDIGEITSVAITQTDANGRVNELTLVGTSGVYSLQKEEIRTFFSSSSGGSLESRNFIIVDSVSSENSEDNTIFYIAENGDIKEVKIDEVNAIGINSGYNTFESITVYGSNGISKTYSTNDIPSYANSSSGDTVTFKGKGWGHGVGMSQYGAKGMAEEGFTYDEILEYYFTGVTIS